MIGNIFAKAISSIVFEWGALAQLVERNNGIVEVIGSIPLRSIFHGTKPLTPNNIQTCSQKSLSII